jgi:cytochrome c556
MIGVLGEQGTVERSRCRTVFALCLALILPAFIVGTPRLALTQEPGETPTKDIIFARKIMMGSIDMNMDEIETMTTAGGTLNLSEGREHADIISIMLMSFPHLFPARTNQWTPNADRDPATDTYAAPELWGNFADFYERAAAASKIAFDASNAKGADEFRALIAQLRTACNSCHAIYQKTD